MTNEDIKTFIIPRPLTVKNEKMMLYAKITVGKYNTKDYRVIKTYTKPGWLKKGLKKLEFPYVLAEHGDVWNNFTLRIMY